MSKLKLSYFDFINGRGEAARLAFVVGGIPFEDHRIPVSEWPNTREQMFFHAVPVLSRDNDELTQSNTINRFVGKLAGLYPEDAWEAARCDEIMDAVEEMLVKLVATFGSDSPDNLKARRIALAEGPFPFYLERLHTRLIEAGGEYFADSRLTVCDLAVAVWIRNLTSGGLDHIPVDLADRIAPLLIEHRDNVLSHPAIQSFYANG
ncbi:MAG: glutathione S-transferase [Hyphomicrobiaceae bacterium]|jgi:glutathione S-transferase